MSDLSRLNPTPHAIAVYASPLPSPTATQHSLPSGRCPLLGPDFHRLDRTSFPGALIPSPRRPRRAHPLECGTQALGYAGAAKKKNPLASPLYDAAPAAAAPANPVYGTWVQGPADTEHADPLSISDIGHQTNTYTAQAGIDRTQLGILSSGGAGQRHVGFGEPDGR